MAEPVIRSATAADVAHWLRLRCALWPEGSEAAHLAEIEAQLDTPSRIAVLLADDVGGDGPIGFAEFSIRPCAEGCRTSQVAYLEGWYVDEAHRRRGIGQALVAAGAAWARGRGCAEMASDAAPDNEASRLAHLAAGFEDVGLVRCFRREILPTPDRTATEAPIREGEAIVPAQDVRIRALSIADADAVARLYEQSATDLRTLGCDGPFRFDAAIFRRDGDGQNPAFGGIGASTGAHAGAPLIGYLLYTFGYDTDRAARHLFVLDLLVDRAHRSRGIGAALMQEARRLAAAHGATELAWVVHERNRRAVRFYERLGAELAEEIRVMRWA